MSEFLLEWMPKMINQLGYFGIALLMFLENLFPPIPSELIMPLAGFTVSQGNMNFVLVVIAGVVGTVLGAYPWYYIGKFLNEEKLEHLADKYGKWISVSAKDIHKANNWFNRHGGQAVFFCRLVPGVRTLISLPAGINGMPLFPFTLYSGAGTTIWVLFLTTAGYKLGNHYELINEYLGPISKIVLVSLIILFVLWLLRKRLRQAS
jgi:membrane protein DedA with SNARE-associated domain